MLLMKEFVFSLKEIKYETPCSTFKLPASNIIQECTVKCHLLRFWYMLTRLNDRVQLSIIILSECIIA